MGELIIIPEDIRQIARYELQIIRGQRARDGEANMIARGKLVIYRGRRERKPKMEILREEFADGEFVLSDSS